jgi:hypothetical protein
LDERLERDPAPRAILHDPFEEVFDQLVALRRT